MATDKKSGTNVGRAIEGETRAGTLTSPTFNVNDFLIGLALSQALGGTGNLGLSKLAPFLSKEPRFFFNPITASQAFQTAPGLVSAGPVVGFIPRNPAASRGLRNFETTAAIVNTLDALKRLPAALEKIKSGG